MLVQGKVYDVQDLSLPCSKEISQKYAGKDATQVFLIFQLTPFYHKNFFRLF